VRKAEKRLRFGLWVGSGRGRSVSVIVRILGGESKGEGAGLMVSSSGEVWVTTVSRANVDWEFLLDFLLLP